MFKVGPRNDAIESLELRDEAARSFAALAPGRGGLLSRLALGGRHLFFLDEATLRDPSKNVRGGNPVLFPSPGKLADDTWSRGGKSGRLGQHGFGRTQPWEVARTSDDGAATATLRLVSNDETRANYPWDFVAEYTYTLKGTVLRIDQHVTNTGRDAMPFGAGFHPYFHVKQSDKARTKIETKATRAFDNTVKKEVTVRGIDLVKPEVDLHLLDHEGGAIAMVGPTGTVHIRASSEYRCWVIWTLAGKDFVCVEPWTCPGNALNTGDGLVELGPGEERTLWVEYELVRPAS